MIPLKLPKMQSFKSIIILLIFSIFFACQADKNPPSLFTLLTSAETSVDFVNSLDFNADFNIYTYRNFYNGGGVAVGDVNNDGLMDIFFTANMKSNRLYLNKGDFKFEDITEYAGVGGSHTWSTGVTMTDVNGDGWLDIYVCNSGHIAGDNKKNELFINSGKTFSLQKGIEAVQYTDQAEKYGLDDEGFGTQAVFFDYDKDGDLDAYLVNNSFRSIFDFEFRENQRTVRDELGGDKLYRNDYINPSGESNSVFTDISAEAGIYGSEIGFGLGVTVGDVNRDGWLDIFVSNDFFERDYLYMNNRDGTYREDLENQIQSLSVASMGADIADINNDAYPEIFVTEMLPKEEKRFKTKMTFENWNRYQLNFSKGYYHQFTRNVLQLNNRDSTFSEIGRLAGIEATDWSWGALIADYDNDGFKDIFVGNGLYKDILDQDFINFVSKKDFVRQMVTHKGVNYQKLIDTITSTPISNYMFKNNGDLTFHNMAAEWGLDTPSHSNGSAYSDLDNDGDLDLVVSNVNAEAFIFRNEAGSLFVENNYLKVNLIGKGMNPFAVGARVTLIADGEHFYIESISSRGFQSSIDYRANFGLGNHQMVDSLIVEWPLDEVTVLTNVDVNQTITIRQSDSVQETPGSPRDDQATKLFKDRTRELDWSYSHKENRFIDFNRDILIYHMLSTEGPHICKADVNGNGLEDFFVGGAANQAGALFIQLSNGRFEQTNTRLFELDRAAEDLDCIFFDADNDGDQDLYVARGGNEFLVNSNALIDQLYLNDGSGNLSRSPQFLPTFKPESSACVQAADYDRDGDLDLFVGIRMIPGFYGLSTNGYILNNNGKGKFTNVTEQIAPELTNLGMITDVLWLDYDRDQDDDLIIVGEWMPITFFENQQGRFRKTDNVLNNSHTEGWWNCLKAGDFDMDGDMDLVVGNHGLNSRFEASKEKPIQLYIKDFDLNGTPDPVICQFNGDKAYPLALRHDLLMQLPGLKKKYLKYSDYKDQTIEDIFTEKQLSGSVIKTAYNLNTSLLINSGDGTFLMEALPLAAQFSPTYGILVEDFDKDDYPDILLGGNLYGVKPEVGRYDASYGLMLKGRGDNTFETIFSRESGFFVKGEVRDIMTLNVEGKTLVLVTRNNEQMQVFEY